MNPKVSGVPSSDPSGAQRSTEPPPPKRKEQINPLEAFEGDESRLNARNAVIFGVYGATSRSTLPPGAGLTLHTQSLMWTDVGVNRPRHMCTCRVQEKDVGKERGRRQRSTFPPGKIQTYLL